MELKNAEIEKDTIPSSDQNRFNRHKECNQHQQLVPKVPFNKSLNRNTPPRAVLDGVFCVRGDAFKDYDVTSWPLVVYSCCRVENICWFIFVCRCHNELCSPYKSILTKFNLKYCRSIRFC